MSTVIICILSIALFLCLILYAADFIVFMKNRYSRFHIGRKVYNEWVISVENCARRWLTRTPTVKITDNSRYVLIDMLTGKYRSKTIQSWQKAALIMGLHQSKKQESVEQSEQAAASLLTPDGEWKNPPVAVDSGMLSCAILQATDNTLAVKPAMDQVIAIIQNNINADGMISYTKGPANPDMYVDTIGLSCPFLAMYAKIYNKPEYADIAVHNIKMFHDYGLLANSCLPNHAFNIRTKMPLGVFGWGRGTGWYVIGLMDTLPYLMDPEHCSLVTAYIKEAAESYIRFQREDGGFGPILQRGTQYDSSATAVMAWFYARCAMLFHDPKYTDVSRKSLERLRKVTRITGAIDWCQGDTKDIGVFAQTYDIMPFAQGMTLRAIYESKEV